MLKVYILHYMCVYTPFCYVVPVGIIRTEIRDYQVQQLPDDDG